MKKSVCLFLLSIIWLFAGCRESDSETQARPPQPTTEVTATAAGQQDSVDFEKLRQQLVDNSIVARGIQDEDVIRAMRTVPRHMFVPEDLIKFAYEDHPLPIGYGQTISQPYIVAWMTDLLELEPGDKVLEIGTGSGYQAAVLAEFGYVDVYSIEIIPELVELATHNLENAGYTNVHIKQGDGYFGWQEQAPFDAIIVTAAPDHLPQPLVDQINETGRIVIPIGPPGGYQSLWRFEIEGENIVAYNMGGVRFVPLTREDE